VFKQIMREAPETNNLLINGGAFDVTRNNPEGLTNSEEKKEVPELFNPLDLQDSQQTTSYNNIESDLIDDKFETQSAIINDLKRLIGN
jgi:hypothetical protein